MICVFPEKEYLNHPGSGKKQIAVLSLSGQFYFSVASRQFVCPWCFISCCKGYLPLFSVEMLWERDSSNVLVFTVCQQGRFVHTVRVIIVPKHVDTFVLPIDKHSPLGESSAPILHIDHRHCSLEFFMCPSIHTNSQSIPRITMSNNRHAHGVQTSITPVHNLIS